MIPRGFRIGGILHVEREREKKLTKGGRARVRRLSVTEAGG